MQRERMNMPPVCVCVLYICVCVYCMYVCVYLFVDSRDLFVELLVLLDGRVQFLHLSWERTVMTTLTPALQTRQELQHTHTQNGFKTHTYTHLHTHTDKHTHIYTNTLSLTHTHTHTHSHAHTHTHTQTDTHIPAQLPGGSLWRSSACCCGPPALWSVPSSPPVTATTHW